ncbi:MAG: 30S ribosomal protein S20 [Halobacteriovoraceae bacterium]|nr:30S ribosomal protein S20 [Halobacteriovoraceae bacterium]MCB9093999.1 30S ribosomal protein S20 [Halobacteriovoraceae bacterium]
MANHKSAIKRARQNKNRRARNRSRKSEVRTAIKKVRAALSENKKDVAAELFVKAQSLLSRLAKTSAINKKTAARYTSRLASSVNKA